MAKNLLITGATGKQGGAVVAALLASRSAADINIFAVTRDPSSAAAKSLASNPRVQLVKGDLNDSQALFEGLPPIWGVYSLQTFAGKGSSTAVEQEQGIKLVDAAVAHGHVKHFVYTSADRGGKKSNSDPTDIPHFISKYHIEKHLLARARETGLGYTILRPVAFMENLTNDFGGKGFTAAWRVALHGKPLQLVSTKDVGWFGAEALINSTSEAYANTDIALAGDSLTYDQAAEVFKQKTGQPLPTTFDIVARIFLWASKEIGVMFRWFGTDGFGADIPALKKLHPDMLTFGDWLEQRSPWKKSA